MKQIIILLSQSLSTDTLLFQNYIFGNDRHKTYHYAVDVIFPKLHPRLGFYRDYSYLNKFMRRDVALRKIPKCLRVRHLGTRLL